MPRPSFARLNDRRGFVMTIVLFTMVLMTTMAVASMSGAADEQRASMAIRKSAEAFYAAETGLAAVVVEWNDTTSTLDSIAKALSSGGSLDLGWDTLPTGARYHASIQRLDTGVQPLFLVQVRAQAMAGSGERAVSLLLTSESGTLSLGGCCQAAAMVRGGTALHSNTGITGTDTDPPEWSASVCAPYARNNKPGLINDPAGIDSISISSSATLSSGDSSTNDDAYLPEPAVVVDNSMSDATFDQYGTRSWQDIKDMATTVIGNGPGSQVRIKWGGDPATDDTRFGPRYHTTGDGHGHSGGDPVLGACDTTHPLNFGAATGPCADHFPVILVQGEVEIKDIIYQDQPDGPWEKWYMQGIVVMDTLSNGMGSEFELESPGTFAGIIIGKGCVDLEDGSQTYGALFVDGKFFNNDTCESPPLTLQDGENAAYEHTDLYYSDCVVQEALRRSGMGDVLGAGEAGVRRVTNRSFHDLLR